MSLRAQAFYEDDDILLFSVHRHDDGGFCPQQTLQYCARVPPLLPAG